MALPRMLLLEDDPAVRRFVEIALDTLELELLPCATLAEAYSALERDPVQLVLTDMTLPDGSGLDLLQWLSERGMACRTLVFSGSVDAALHQHLQDRGVWRVLTMPASVGSLVDAVGAALADLARETAAPPSSMPATATDLVNKYFGGNQGLFVAFRQSCLDQFVEDLRMGDPAVQAQDSAGLRRIAHNLKSVLTLLGEEEGARLALRTETWAAQGAWALAASSWGPLRAQVHAFGDRSGDLHPRIQTP